MIFHAMARQPFAKRLFLEHYSMARGGLAEETTQSQAV
jgi:hypothetical protein